MRNGEMSSAKRVLLFVTGNAAKAREIEEIISVAVGDLTVERCNVDCEDIISC